MIRKIFNIIASLQAQDLTPIDVWGADPFVRVTCASGEIQTDTK